MRSLACPHRQQRHEGGHDNEAQDEEYDARFEFGLDVIVRGLAGIAK